jgi:outer membrane immunogenic protein
VNIGYSVGRFSDHLAYHNDPAVFVFDFGTLNNNANGVIGGGQIGYNWQGGNWLFGIEADLDATGQKGTLNCNTVIALVTTICSDEQKLSWLGTVRGRLGLTADRWLIYATGGLAYGEIRSTPALTFVVGAPGVSTTFPPPSTHWKAGWTVGAGVEGALAGNWTVKLEYLYVDLGTVSDIFPLVPLPPGFHLDVDKRIQDHVVRIGLNYRFGGAVVASY